MPDGRTSTRCTMIRKIEAKHRRGTHCGAAIRASAPTSSRRVAHEGRVFGSMPLAASWGPGLWWENHLQACQYAPEMLILKSCLVCKGGTREALSQGSLSAVLGVFERLLPLPREHGPPAPSNHLFTRHHSCSEPYNAKLGISFQQRRVGNVVEWVKRDAS